MSEVRVCPKCGKENPADVDFCAACGEYLRWEPSIAMPAVRQPLSQPRPGAPADPAGDEADAPVSEALVPAAGGDSLPAVQAQPAPPARPDDVVVILRLPGDERADPGVVATRVAPGEQATLVALVRNQSGIVDNYDLRIDGLPHDWWTVTPATVYLVPFGAPGGNYEEEVEIRLHPPRSAEAEAGAWPITVVAHSKARDGRAGAAEAVLDVLPYEELETELRPERASGRRRAKFAIAVRNRANTEVDLAFSGADQEGKCRFDFEQPLATAQPGQLVGSSFVVRPPKQIWIGRHVDRRIEIAVRPAGSDAPVLPRTATFRQQPWLPWWLTVVVPIAIAAIVLVLALRPDMTTVPDIVGKQEAAAAQALENAGLEVGERTTEPTRDAQLVDTVLRQLVKAGDEVEKGTKVGLVVYAQAESVLVPDVQGLQLDEARQRFEDAGLELAEPTTEVTRDEALWNTVKEQLVAAGEERDPGTGIGVVVYVGSGKVKVPQLVGRTYADALERARTRKLELVARSEPADPETSTIVRQVPDAGASIPEGSSVDVFFEAPVEEEPVAPAESEPAGEPPPPAVLPDVAGQSVSDATAALAAAGIAVAPDLTRELSEVVPDGSVIRTVQEGSTATLVVSTGAPPLAYDNGSDLFLLDPVSKKPTRLTKSSDLWETEPAWSPDGATIAFRRAAAADAPGQIWLMDPQQPQSARQLTDEGGDDRRPAFSPSGLVVAFVRKKTGRADSDLCFKRIDTDTLAPACIDDPETNVIRPTWSPDGFSIVVISLVQDAAGALQSAELLQYNADRASAARPQRWQKQGVISTGLHPEGETDVAQYVAWSPSTDEPTLAVVANWARAGFLQVFLVPTPGNVVSDEATPLNVGACTLAWRPDAKALAVYQADDCASDRGDLVSVDPADPSHLRALRNVGVFNPAWAPIPPSE